LQRRAIGVWDIRRGTLGGIAFIALLALTPTRAEAFALVVQSAAKPVPGSGQATQKEPCPKGRWVTGGGVLTTGSTLEDEVADSGPYDGSDQDRKPDDGWRTSVNAGPDGAHMTTFAICEDYSPTVYRTSTTAYAPGDIGSFETLCPTDTKAVGGGMSVSGRSTRMPLRSTAPLLGFDGWGANAANPTQKTVNAKVTAICMPVAYHDFSVEGVHYTSRSLDPMSQEAVVGPELTLNDAPRLGCPYPGPGRVYGGGAAVSFYDGPGDAEIASLYPVDGDDADSEPNDAWKAWFNNEATGTRTGSAIVVCQNG
jgi:hypothetical protein